MIGGRGFPHHSGRRRRPFQSAFAARHLIYDLREQLVLYSGSLGVVHNVAEGKFQRSAAGLKSNHWFEKRTFDSIVFSDPFPRSLGFHQVITYRLFRNPQQHFSCVLVIASAGKLNFDLVPDKSESLRIIENQPLQHYAVWNSNNSPIVEVTAHPVAGFHHRCSHDGDINHVSFSLIHLDSVAHTVEIGEADRNESTQACNHILQCNDYSRSHNPHRESDVLQTVCKENRYEGKDDYVGGSRNHFPNVVTLVTIAKVWRQGALQQAKRAPDQNNAQDGVNQFSDQRKSGDVIKKAFHLGYW